MHDVFVHAEKTGGVARTSSDENPVHRTSTEI